MTFKDDGLRDEIDALFSEVQEGFERAAALAAVFNENGRRERGFRIFTPDRRAPTTPQRAAYFRQYMRQRSEEDIRQRLLAGERPKLGGRGRPPTRWFKIAAELGIEIPGAPRTRRDVAAH